MSSEIDQPSPWIVNATAETFQQDAIQRSHEAVVVVDFWAPWCAPCRALGPVLEKLANDFDGKFILVKANTDELPDAAAQFNVQGIPAVYGIVDGEVVDFFSGALPEPQLQAWLEQLISISAVAEARRLEDTAPEAAEARYRALLQQAPSIDELKLGLARSLLNQQRFDDCKELIAELEARGFLEPEAERIKASLELRGIDEDELARHRAAAEANPDDLPLQFQLAAALAGAQHFPEAMDVCLELVQKDRHGVGEKARELMVEILRVLPEDSELTTEYRRKLSISLY